MSKIFGANWKTTVSGGIQTLLSAVVTGSLTFPKDWSDKKEVGIFLLVVIGTLFGVKFATDAKSKEVTGGTVQQTTNFNPAEAGTQSLVDQTVKATVESGEHISPEQAQAVYNKPKP